MRRRRVCPTLVCLMLLASALPGCGEALDQAAAHEHDLIDHEYDRRDQLVDRIFVHVNAALDQHQDHQVEIFDRVLEAQTELFRVVLEAGPPPGFGPSTCSFSSEPSGAELFVRNIFDEWEYVGRTPLVVERPLSRARAIEVRAEGHATATGYMISDQVQGACADHFVLAPLSRI